MRGKKIIGQIGDHFGRLIVVSVNGKNSTCMCDCGNEVVSTTRNLLMGNTKSCKCLRIETSTARVQTHGLLNQFRKENNIWRKMRRRCNNPDDTGYKNYGGRGISVCPQWEEFSQFLIDVGPRPSPQHSLDRYPNNDGNYEPGNVRWATRSEQAQNTRRTRMSPDKVTAMRAEFSAVPKPLKSDMAEKYGVSRTTAWNILTNKTWREIA